MASYGPTLIDQVIQYLSASGIGTGDPKQAGGCLRRWFYRYVLGIKEPFTGAKKLGADTHEEIEHYLRTGELTLGHLAMSARVYIPDPNPDFLIEQEIKGWGLTCAGIKVIGKMDLISPFSVHLDAQGARCMDPPNTVEVCDWKTTSSIKNWAKTGQELKKTVQMPLYGMAAARHFDAEHVRLSHVYMQTRGRAYAQKSTILVHREELETRWEQIEGVARTLIDVAKETDVNKVPASRHSCSAYRGCFFADRCPRSRQDTLESVFGVTKAQHIKERKSPNTMSTVTDQLNALKTQQAAVPSPAPLTTALPAGLPEHFAEVVKAIEEQDRGFPPMNAEVSRAYATLKGIDLSTGAAFSGQGKKYGTISQPLDMELLYNLAKETTPGCVPVAPIVDTPAPVAPAAVAVAVSLTPPETPASDPALSAVPVEGFPAAATAPAAVAPQVPAATVAPPAPSTMPELPAPPATAAPALDNATTNMPNFKRMKKPEVVEAAEALFAENANYRSTVGKILQDPECMVAAPASEGITLYINAIPSQPFDRLDEYIQGLCRSLEAQTGAKDIRCSDVKALDYGKWKGAIAVSVRDTPPAPGVYYLDTRGDEIAAEVANALAGESSLVVRGV